MNKLMKIMCHVGPWSASQYDVIARSIDPRSEIILASGHKAYDQTKLSSRYYDFLRDYSPERGDLTPEDYDMIKRCRLLRSIPPEEAKKHLDCMRLAIREAFDLFKPDLVLSETIDSFLMDLIFSECNARNTKFIGLVPSFVNGYFRVTARGEYNNLRLPSPEEVEKVLSVLEAKNYHPEFLNQSKQQPYFSVIKRWTRNLIKPPYFYIKRAISGERYNYHYWATQIVSCQWFHLFPRLSLGDHKWEKRLRESSKPVIYIPLQMIPEATVDYWCDDLNSVDYDRTLVDLVKRLSGEFTFLIKEHPNVLGFRNPGIYNVLSSIDGVIICPTNINSNRLVELCNTVLVWTGTAGFEAALRGKPVLTMCNTYYVSGRMFKVINNFTPSSEILNFLNAQTKPLTRSEKFKMVSYLLSGLLPGKYTIDGSWRKDNLEDLVNAKKIGEALAGTL